MNYQRKADGHSACISLFDEATALVPLNNDEARWLTNILGNVIMNLRRSGDFPEEREYVRLKNNLLAAHLMLDEIRSKNEPRR